MYYSSTRGGVRGRSFEDVVLSGYASDGGMFMPEVIPTVTSSTLTVWATLCYSDLVKEVARLFIDPCEIPDAHLKALIDRALSRFSHPDVINMAALAGGLHLLELFHGPTFAFKDLALSCVAQFMEYFLTKRKQRATILVGTSGDTGGAAIESVRSLQSVDIVVLFPRGRCSRVQELHMTTVLSDNVHVFSLDGTSDDTDVIIKPLFDDEEFVKKHNLCALNSINWARIMVQISFYFYSYFQLDREISGMVEVVVPTGGCGSVTGGVIAHRMGLPIRLVCAVNSNDTVSRTVNEGDLSLAAQVTPTLASAMDIQFPYNLERILYVFSDFDAALVKTLLTEFEKNNKTTIPRDLRLKIAEVITSDSVSDDEIKEAMRQCWEENSYLICPHTATAIHYHYNHREELKKRVCIATASPVKFEDVVLSAGLSPQTTPAVESLDKLPTRCEDMVRGDKGRAMLRTKIQEIYHNRVMCGTSA